MKRNPAITFLVTYFANEPLLRLCLSSIRKFHPEAEIVISQEESDKEIAEDLKPFRLIKHRMRTASWAGVCEGLMKACSTEIGILVEHDCFLLKPLTPLVKKLNTVDLVGVEDLIPNFRHSPGFAMQNFFILNVKRFLGSYGGESIYVEAPEQLGHLKNIESAYGISQRLEKKYFLPVKKSGYGLGTFYGRYIHHFWYGSFPKREIQSDGVDIAWLQAEQARLIKDYEDRYLHNRI